MGWTGISRTKDLLDPTVFTKFRITKTRLKSRDFCKKLSLFIDNLWV